ncbi:hypothetical protein JYT23_01340 [Mariprofundus ferrooxydans]|nr:hypothetical protein [Mariprofundus ferrooxydans]
MTPRVKDNAVSDAVEVFMSNGMEGLAGAVEILINAAMCFERSEERVRQANGFKPKQLGTRLGSLQLQSKTIDAYSRAIRYIGEHFGDEINNLSEQQLEDYFIKRLSTHFPDEP